ncbi:msx2-interacting protein isoform X7 [Chiloscyllium plagiosum]|uniref:msx2-interacting protein isoform X7 n=1 Tax=Chiloscyllium plagiosum TaxID=36176 RepID=UPI001CB88AC3|nr:msx2-interacting protein isoform X7 [Chiloscyllium plagiosum]
MVRETRHLWVGNLPENVREDKIIEHFKRYGRVESVKILPKRGSEGGVAAFVDFVDIKSAQKAHNSVNKMGDRDLRTDYNEPGTIPSAARGLDDTVPIGTRTREVSGFRGGGGGPTYGPPPSLHGREGRYERRLDGASDNRERTYDHSAYGHHDRTTAGFDRPRHYEQDYYRDPRDRTIQHGVYYGSRSRSPTRFEAHDPRYEQRGREQFAISSVVHRDLYREDITREVRGRRQEKNYQHSRSRSPHSSRSGNQSPQRSSQASRSRRSPSGSGSRSRSSSSDSVSSSSSTSSDSSDSSSSSSDESPARSVQSAAVPAPPVQLPTPVEKDEPRKSYGIKVQNLPVRSTDTSLKDGLFHEFKKYGKVTSVQIHGASEERYGLVFFRQQEDQEKAMNASKGKLFFGMQIEVTAWTGPGPLAETESENEFRPLDDRIDEFHPKATRTLFIGNLEKTTTYGDLRNIFERFGEIVDIDIKKVNGVPQYAFLQYCDIASVCKAIKKMDGEYLGNNRLKVRKEKYSHLLIRNIHLSGIHSEILLGFGKSMPTNCVWLDGLSSNITEQYLSRHFCRYGPVLKVDFANRESQLAFYRSMEVSGQDIRDLYEIFAERREDRRGSYHEYPADRAYFDAVRGPAAVFPEDPRRDYRARSRDFYAEWDPYQGDYYDPRYYEDPREYRDYRDPYEQDIREYSYRQRERERERERYESDRERDHERRTCERSQSPTHSRRAQSCSASPAQSERHQSDSVDSERRIYSRSSDRSGSCSSLSPPRYDKADKPDKVRPDRYEKNEKEKDRLFEPERAEKRTQRKDKSEKLERTKKIEKSEVEKLDKKEKIEKLKIRKVKPPSPSSLSSETDHEVDRDLNLDSLKGKTKQGKDKAEKEGASKNRLDLIPCVVLTRVKEREAKMIEPLNAEKPRGKSESDTVKSPSAEQNKVQLTRLDQTKTELSKLEPSRPKVPKEKLLASQIEVVGKEVKIKHKKNLKSEPCPEATNAMDIDKLEARKRRFADPTLRTDRQKLEVKRGSQEEEELRLGLRKQPELATWREMPTVGKEGDLDRRPLRKELLKREHRKVKQEKLISAFSPREGQESATVSAGIGLRPSIETQSRLSEPSEEPVETPEIALKKQNTMKPPNKGIVQPLLPHLDEVPGEGEVKREERKRKYSGTPEDTNDHKSAHEKLQTIDADEKLGIDIDYTQSYRKQMEQNRRLKQQQEMEMAKSEKYNSPRKENADEFERRSLVHEVGKPPQDVTDDSPPVKRRKTDQFDFETSMKRERNYRSSRQLSEDSEKTVLSPGFRHILSYQDEDDNDSPHQALLPKEPKDSPKLDSAFQIPVREEPLKCNAHESNKREQMLDLARFKIMSQSSEEEAPRWETRLKLDASRSDVSFPSSIIKRDGIRKRSVRELEPGEVPSDSDEDNEHKSSHSPKASTSFESSRLPLFLRNREDRLSDLKLSSSLERNKFYSFALDKTITPDTKALLERAKSLSSSREENWSFLDRDSRFASFRKDKDKEKVESAPRPIPSWYMKKKKIRTDSEGKIDEKKEDHKEDEQERQELFASRFLHSSIFEQDSKRLQHLERKEDDMDVISGRLFGRQGSVDGSSNTPDLIQEPVVLFHSRFIELTRMQQKEKEKDQKPKELERREIEKEVQPKTTEPVSELKESDLKNTCPLLRAIVPPPPPLPPPLTTSFQALPAEQQETVKSKTANETLVTESVVSNSGENRSESGPAADASKPVIVNVSPCEEIEPIVVNKQLEANVTSEPVASGQESVVREHLSYLDTKPPTPGGNDVQEICINAEPKVPEINADSSKPIPKELVPEEYKDNKNPPISVELDINKKEEHSGIRPQVSDNEMDTEPSVVLKEKKNSKNKRTKTPLQAITATISEKPVTRKSERIDREKLKRSSSPRGDTQKLQDQKLDVEKVSKNTAKSPSSAPESEISEPSLPLGRTRRRNVRSVYATVDDGPSLIKDSTDTLRSTRKRAEKEVQESPNVQTPPRRGRPPKSRRRPGEEVPCFKADQVKQDAEETETKDGTESTKPVEGWKSPRSQKTAQSHSSAAQSSQIGRKGVKTEPRTAEICVERTADAAEPLIEQSSIAENIKASAEGNEIVSDQKSDRNDGALEKCPSTNNSGEMIEKRSVEKGSKSKCGRGRNAKASEDKMCLRNLEIRLSTEEVKGVLHSGDGEVTVTPKKDPPRNDSQSPELVKEGMGDTFLGPPKSPEKEIAKPECSPEAVQRAKQIELERAVENIAKLTEIPTVHPYKETADEPDVRTEEDVEKPAHQASETELAAAIDSIIADESAEPDNFPSAPRYPTEQTVAGISEDQMVLPTPPDTLQPETDQDIVNILESAADVGASGRLLAKGQPSNRLISKIPASGRLLSKAPVSGRSVSKSPASAENVVTEVPSSVESMVSEVPTSTDNIIPKVPTSADNIVPENSTPVDTPSADSVISKAPVPLASTIAKVSVSVESVISKAPGSVESVISKTPASVESVISKVSVSAESVISKVPVSTESMVSETPISPEGVVPSALSLDTSALKTPAMDSHSAISVSSASRSPLLTTVAEAKSPDVCFQRSGNISQKTENLPLPEPAEVPRTPSRRGRSKPRMTRRNRRGSTSRKGELADGNSSEPEPVPVSADIKQNSVTAETISEKCANKSVVEPISVSKSDTDNLTKLEESKLGGMKPSESDKDSTTEAISPHDPLHSSACNEDNRSPPCFKLKQHTEFAPEAQSKQNMSRVAINAFPTTTTAKISVTPAPALGTAHISSGVVPDWMSRHEASRACSTPPPSAPPPDTKASDLDTNSSTLRKILMEPKYVSATGVPTTFVTTAINEPLTSVRTEEAFPSSEASKLVLDEKAVVPPSSTGGQQISEMPVFNEKEKHSSPLISPKVTSVISRIPPSLDQEEVAKVTANSRGPGSLPSQTPSLPTVSLTKQKYRSNLTENSRYKLGTVAFIGDESRQVDNLALNQGSSPRLRVNTSEGVVVLSYSGQKTEGPQRISAPISQIPPASAVDIEFQQSVSKSQAKPEPISQSQPVSKGSQTPSGYSNVIGTHSSSILVGHGGPQSYNASPVISSIKQEHQIHEKSETAMHSGTLSTQPGAVKIVYNPLPNIVSTNKKGGDPAVPKIEAVKVTQQSTLSPGISPHHAAMPSKLQSDTNHISSGRGTPTERGLPLPVSIKQEPHSPRTSVHSPSPFPKVCQPSSTSTTSQSMNANMVINAGLTMTQFVPSVHLPEQSVIMPPHSVTQTQVVSLGHLSQGEVRMNAPSVPGIPFGIRPETHHPSPRAVLQPQMELRSQRSNTPQSTVIRDLCMPQISNQHQPDEELLHYHGLRRGSAPLQPDVLVMQPDYRIHPGGLRLDQYNVPQEMLLRDVRMMYPPMTAVGDVHGEARQARTPDGSVKTPPTSKTPQPAKEAPKTSEVKMTKSPHNEARLINVPPGMPMSQSVMVSHGVQLMHQVPSSFHDYPRVYQDPRNFHHSHLGHPPFGGMNLPSRSMTPQVNGISEGEHVHPGQRSKTPQISQDTKGSTASEHPHHVSITRLTGQMELHSPHLQHLQRERVQPEANLTSYPSPTGVSMPIKHELSSPHQPLTPKQPSFISTQSSTPGTAPSPVISRSDPPTTGKQEPQPPSGSQRPVDMVQLLTKYPIVWQGLLALKNDTAAVQLHFVSGNNVLAHRSLPAPEGGPPLRIAQRMRLEATQLEGVARRMTVETDYCLLLALPCGRDQEDVVSQTESLKAGFISYLQLKQAAGIINVPNPGSNQPAYVLQIFPPCEFSESHLSRLAPDLLASISNISPHLMIVIASV